MGVGAQRDLGRLGGAVLHDGDVEPDRAHRAGTTSSSRYPVTSLSPITLLSPLFGIFFGVTLLNDQLTARMLVGGAVTLIGCPDRRDAREAHRRYRHLIASARSPCKQRSARGGLPPAIFSHCKSTMPARKNSRIPRNNNPARRYSSVVVDGNAQAPSRAMLRAVGYKDADFSKPAIGIASTWSNLTPCNMHIDKLAKAAADTVDKSGGKSTTFGTITVSDGISNGTPGMRYSLVSREVIADSIEAVSGAQGFDGVIAIGGCDKNMPGCLMALARLDRPAVFVYGGTIKPGKQRRDIISVFEAVGAHAAGKISDKDLLDIERTSIPGPGSCGGMYTANTMASAIEALGMSLPNSSAQEAVSSNKLRDCA